MISIWNGIHSGRYPFGIVPIRDGVHSGRSPFGMLSILDGTIRDDVYSRWRPFGIVYESIFQYDGDKSDVIVPIQEQVNAVAVSDIASASFFKNLAPSFCFIATKSKRYFAVYRKFIADEISIDKLLSTGIIRPVVLLVALKCWW